LPTDVLRICIGQLYQGLPVKPCFRTLRENRDAQSGAAPILITGHVARCAPEAVERVIVLGVSGKSRSHKKQCQRCAEAKRCPR